MARTSKVCAPTDSPEYSSGDVQPVKAAPFSEHSNVDPASSAEKVNVADVSVVVAAGPLSTVVSGGVVSGGGAGDSTVHEYSAGDRSRLPAASMARTSKVCAPTTRSVYTTGEAQAANQAPSMAHSNVEPASSAEKVNVADVSVVVAAGPLSTVVSGGVVSGGGACAGSATANGDSEVTSPHTTPAIGSLEVVTSVATPPT